MGLLGDTIRTGPTRRHAGQSHPVAGPTPDGMVVLGRYRLHRRLGIGGFATVWLARDERLDRDVAIKFLARELVVGGRFEREARAAARLSHPAIVTLYEAAVDDEGAYLVSELVRGSTLAELSRAGRLSDRDVVAAGVALCDALEHAHGHGVVHRDVKPSNVLVPERPGSPAEVAKLTDFGVARLIDGSSLTRTGDVVGTAAYMAPEQAEGREAAADADLYSLALVLYEALTGLNPVARDARPSRTRQLPAHVPPLRRYRRELPRDLAAAVDLALHPRARERGTVADLRAALVAGLDDVEDLPGVVASPWPRRPRGVRDQPGPSADLLPGPDRVRSRPSWQYRALAGASSALAAAWLTATAFSSPPLAPAGAALIAFLWVAALPRTGWLGLILAAVGLMSAQGRPGTALVVALAGAIPVLLLPRRPTRWPVAAVAPALGAASLAGAWPALAGRESSPWRRAGLGATGWIWTVAAGLIVGHGVYAGLAPGIPARTVWMGSAGQTLGHVLWPVLASGLLVPAAAWGVAAVVLPWMVRGPLALRVVLATVWSAALASVTATLVHAVGPPAGLGSGGLVLGAVAGGIAVLVPPLLRDARRGLASSDPAAGLA